MPKRFDCEDEPNEFMEAPCRCDCGNWFDLDDGYSVRGKGRIVCRECKENADECESIRDRIDELVDQPGKKREIAKLKKRLIELGD